MDAQLSHPVAQARKSRAVFALGLATGLLASCTLAFRDERPLDQPFKRSGLPPFPSVGAKVGEVQPNSAVIHSYLLSQPARELLQQPYEERSYRGRPGRVCVEYSTVPLQNVTGPPLPEQEFEHYQRRQSESVFTPWLNAPQGSSPLSNPHNPEEAKLLQVAQTSDTSVHVRLDSLQPGTRYYFRLWIKAVETGLVRASRLHHFSTAPEPRALQDVSFIATTCFHHGKMKDLQEGVWPVQGFRMYRALLDLVKTGQLHFDFAVLNGDTVYLDKPGSQYRTRPDYEIPGLRGRYFDTYILPLTRAFFRQFPAYFLKDDHDWRFNDADPVWDPAATPPRFYRRIGRYYRGPPGPFLGKKIFEEMHPLERGSQSRPYRTFRWGAGLQIWLLETRECRYPSDSDLSRYEIAGLAAPEEGQGDKHLYYPDYCGVPTPEEAWGKEQFNWLVETLKSSDAYFKIIISPTPVFGPDQEYYLALTWPPVLEKADNHVHRYRKELERLLDVLQSEGLTNVYFVSGDRHFVWHSRYQTKDQQFSLHEFGSGPFGDDIVPLGEVFYQDERGAAQLLDSQLRAGFIHVQVKDVAGQPKLRVEWYVMEDWGTPSVRRWEHTFEASAPHLPRHPQ